MHEINPFSVLILRNRLVEWESAHPTTLAIGIHQQERADQCTLANGFVLRACLYQGNIKDGREQPTPHDPPTALNRHLHDHHKLSVWNCQVHTLEAIFEIEQKFHQPDPV